jgi:septum formation protein
MKKSLILASQSPRRRELLSLIEIPFNTINPQVDESLNSEMPLSKAVEDLAYRKAINVLEKYPQAIILAADTIVVLDGEVLGKPIDTADAKRMLKTLSGKSHEVITGVCILSNEVKKIFSSKTIVKFYELSDELIDSYVATSAPMDKAGAYGIQDKGALFVKSIQGDYYTVMGLPLARVYQSLVEYI